MGIDAGLNGEAESGDNRQQNKKTKVDMVRYLLVFAPAYRARNIVARACEQTLMGQKDVWCRPGSPGRQGESNSVFGASRCRNAGADGLRIADLEGFVEDLQGLVHLSAVMVNGGAITRVSYQGAMYRPFAMASPAIFPVIRGLPLSLSALTLKGSLVSRFLTISSPQKCPIPRTSPTQSWASARAKSFSLRYPATFWGRPVAISFLYSAIAGGIADRAKAW